VWGGGGSMGRGMGVVLLRLDGGRGVDGFGLGSW